MMKIQIEPSNAIAETARLPADDQPLTTEYRRAFRGKIDQGLESARRGPLIDAEAVFARIETELAEIEARAARANPEAALAILRRAPDRPPLPGDGRPVGQ